MLSYLALFTILDSLLPVDNRILSFLSWKRFYDLLDIPLRSPCFGEHQLYYQGEASREETHEDEEVHHYSDHCVRGQQLQPLVMSQSTQANKENFANCLKSHGWAQLSHAHSYIGRDSLVMRGCQGKLGHPGHFGDVSEEHDEEPGLLNIVKLWANKSKHDQAIKQHGEAEVGQGYLHDEGGAHPVHLLKMVIAVQEGQAPDECHHH